jgi:hypothetical protein
LRSVKKLQVVAIILAGIVIIAFWLRPPITLELAKQAALRKLTPDNRRVLNSVPSSSILSIPHLEMTSSYSMVEPPGCAVGLPDVEFHRDTAYKIVFTNSVMLVAFFGALDKTNFTLLERALNLTNVFDVVTTAYKATVTGISKQRNQTQLMQYLTLLLYKCKVAPMGFDHSWLQFDRGDLNGFISGDMAKDGKVAVEIYLKEKDEFLSMLIRRKTDAGEMSDVYHILSVLKVRPDIIPKQSNVTSSASP